MFYGSGASCIFNFGIEIIADVAVVKFVRAGMSDLLCSLSSL